MWNMSPQNPLRIEDDKKLKNNIKGYATSIRQCPYTEIAAFNVASSRKILSGDYVDIAMSPEDTRRIRKAIDVQ